MGPRNKIMARNGLKNKIIDNIDGSIHMLVKVLSQHL